MLFNAIFNAALSKHMKAGRNNYAAETKTKIFFEYSSSYKPILLLPLLSKMLEKIFLVRIKEAINKKQSLIISLVLETSMLQSSRYTG